jgi:hypothetical protein
MSAVGQLTADCAHPFEVLKRLKLVLTLDELPVGRGGLWEEVTQFHMEVMRLR